MVVFEGGVVSGLRVEFTEAVADPNDNGGGVTTSEPTSILSILAIGALGGGSLLKRTKQEKA